MENISLLINKATIDWDIEIIEEDKPIEKLKIAFLDNYEPNEIDRKCWNRLNEHQDKINELIDVVNKLKKEKENE